MLFVRKKSDTDIPASQRSNSHPESSSATPPYALPNHCHSTDGESVYSKRNSASSSRRTSMLLHLKSVLQWKDNGIWSPPPSPRSTLLFVPLPQPSHSRNGKVKPLPPLPIVDGGDQDRKCRAQKSFRNVHGRLFSKNTDLVYPLPIDEQEIDRMQTEHLLLKELFANCLYHSPVTDKLRKGAYVLDLGCGCGAWSMEMATQFPKSSFIGCDISPIYPTSVLPQNCTFESCDVNQGLSFSDDSFDFVVSRNMALAVRYDGWEDYVQEMLRVSKSGAYIEFVEMDWDVKCKGVHMKAWNQRMLQCLRKRGINPRIARLLQPLVAPMVNNFHASYVSTPIGSWGGKLGRKYLSMWKALMQASLPLYVSSTAQSEEEYGMLVSRCMEEIDVTRSFCNVWICNGQKR